MYVYVYSSSTVQYPFSGRVLCDVDGGDSSDDTIVLQYSTRSE